MSLAYASLSAVRLSTEECEMGGKRKPDIHVQPSSDGDGWRVTRRGQDRAIAKADTQAEAIDRGKKVAQRDKTELNVHGRDGRVRDKWSYGKDPRDIPG